MVATNSTCRSTSILTDTADRIRADLPVHQPTLRRLRPPPQDWIVVSPVGDDATGLGTSKSPYQTIGFALSTLQRPGQGLQVHPGAYHESGLVTPMAGTADKPLWIRGLVDGPPRTQFAERVRIVGSGAASPCADPPGSGQPVDIIRITQSYWILDTIEIDGDGGCYRAVSVGGTGGTPIEAVSLTRLDIHDITGPQAVRISSARDVTVSECRIHDNWWAPGGQEKDCHGINVLEGAERILIRDNVLYRHSGDSVQVAHSTEPHDPGPAADAELPRNVTIDGNDCSGDFENAIDIKSCRNVTVVGNDLHDYLPSPAQAAGTTPVVAHYDARGLLIDQNVIRDCGRAISIGDLGLPANPQRQLGPIVITGNSISAVRVVAGAGGTGVGIGLDQVAGVDANGQPAPHAVEIHDNGFADIDGAAIVIGGNGLMPRVATPLVANNVFDTTAVCININPAAISERDPSDPSCQGNPLRSGLVSDHNEFQNLPPTPFRRLGVPVTRAQWTVCYDQNSCP
jgi:hypothetical protein